MSCLLYRHTGDGHVIVDHDDRGGLHQHAADKHHQQCLHENREHCGRTDVRGRLAVAAKVRRVQRQRAGRSDQNIEAEYEFVRIRFDPHTR